MEDLAATSILAGDGTDIAPPVDDEPLARSALIQLCNRSADVDVVGEARQRVEPHNLGSPASAFKLLIGEREHRLYPINAEAVDYIESDGNYVTLRSGNSKYISRDSLKRLTADLAECGFIRIERSLLVNIRALLYVEPVGRGTFAFTLSSGTCLHSGASYRDPILRILPMRRFSGRRVPRSDPTAPIRGE
jgi:DNA-binding LytR/AlgR family response regulator